jgi:hypothetical protein
MENSEPQPHRPADRSQINRRHRPRTPTQASIVTNNPGHLLPLTERAWLRRIRDLLDQFVSDLGGFDIVSTAQMALVRRCTVLITEMERRETAFAKAGGADDVSLLTYSTCLNTLRRTLETLQPGLFRRTRDVTPVEQLIEGLDDHEQAAPEEVAP